MFKKMLATLLACSSLYLSIAGSSFAASSFVDRSKMSSGIITLQPSEVLPAGTIVRISKDKAQYDYPYMEGANYPLQLDDGAYSILIAKPVSGNKYKVVMKETVTLETEEPNAVFLQSIPMINWTEESRAVIEAKKRTADSMTDEAKIQAIYQLVTSKLQYDEERAATVKPGYMPDLDEVFNSSKGICYDYAAVFAAMARSVGIPTRLVMGYEAHFPDTYHAWNEVYLDGEWRTVDPTFDAASQQAGQSTPMFKLQENYKTVKFY